MSTTPVPTRPTFTEGQTLTLRYASEVADPAPDGTMNFPGTVAEVEPDGESFLFVPADGDQPWTVFLSDFTDGYCEVVR